jgi:hypothetical protein
VFTDFRWVTFHLDEVAKPPTESGRHAVRHRKGLGVLRQIDVSGLHERPGEATTADTLLD